MADYVSINNILMKEKLLISTLALSCGLSVQAQFSTQTSPSDDEGHWFFGVGGGFHTNFMRYSDLNEDVFPDDKNLNSGVFTVFAQYDFGKNRHFSVRPELSLLRRGGKLDIAKDVYGRYDEDIDGVRYTLKSRYVDVRVPLIYNFLKSGSRVRPYVYVAPVLGFATRGSVRMQADYTDGTYAGYEADLNEANIAGTYFAGMAGIGAKCRFQAGGNTFFLGMEAGYEIGFTDTYGGKEKDGEAVVPPDGNWSYRSYELDGDRKFSGFEVKATLGIPFSVFKKKSVSAPPAPVVVQTPAPVPVVEEKPCYTLDEINDLMLKGESVAGKTICAINDINFEFGESTIKSESYAYLDKLANTLVRTRARIEVKGHTDNVGTEEFNMDLSRKRAQAVVDYLVKRGVSQDKLSYSYYGMSKPLATNDTEEGRTLNRRVEFEILK